MHEYIVNVTPITSSLHIPAANHDLEDIFLLPLSPSLSLAPPMPLTRSLPPSFVVVGQQT